MKNFIFFLVLLYPTAVTPQQQIDTISTKLVVANMKFHFDQIDQYMKSDTLYQDKTLLFCKKSNAGFQRITELGENKILFFEPSLRFNFYEITEYALTDNSFKVTKYHAKYSPIVNKPYFWGESKTNAISYVIDDWNTMQLHIRKLEQNMKYFKAAFNIPNQEIVKAY